MPIPWCAYLTAAIGPMLRGSPALVGHDDPVPLDTVIEERETQLRAFLTILTVSESTNYRPDSENREALLGQILSADCAAP